MRMNQGIVRAVPFIMVALGAALSGAGCSGTATEQGVQVEGGRSASISSGGEANEPDPGPQHCDAAKDGRHEESSYDTSGDDIPDVRKVFLRVGSDDMSRLVLVCRETDLNSDGVKDVARHYSDEGTPVREEADRNFDGKMDQVTFFQDGQTIRQEFDTTGDGKVDLKVFFKDGKPLRSERDMAARSSSAKWQPDRWEYYEEGHMVRMGTDLDGDGKVDRWDRDETLIPKSRGLRSEEAVMDEEAADGGEEGDEGAT